MSYTDQWRQQVNDSLIEAAKLVPFAPDVDLKLELMAVGVLWPIRQPVQDFDVEAMGAVQEVTGQNSSHVLRLVQQWGDDRLTAARELAQADRSKEMDIAIKALIAYFGAFPIFAKQLSTQAKAAALPAQPAPQTQIQPARVFIYYPPEDGQTLAAKVRQKLENKNIPVWQDIIPQQGEKDWWQQATQALTQVDFLVMIMTPAAVTSKTVRGLWRFAHQQGACQMPRIPFMADDLPDDFVNRPTLMKTLTAYFFDTQKEEAIANTVALYGAGGFGKSTLAKAACHHDDIRQAFDNGILWVNLGEDPGDLSRYVIDLIEVLSGERPGFTSLDAAVVRLGELMADRDLLLVIDDVWNAAHLKPFLQGGSRCARLITTRNTATIPNQAQILEIDVMQPKEAVTLLRSQLPDGQQNEMEFLAGRMGGWPLLLKLTNGTLRDHVLKQNQPLPDAINFVNTALDQHGLMAFDQRDTAARNQAISQTIEVSLGLLNNNERARFNELAIFPEDIDIPLTAIEKLWHATGGLDDFDTEELCDHLHGLSLLSKLDLTSRSARLHKMMRGYLMFQQSTHLPHIHNQFLNAHTLPQNHWAGMSPDEPYLWTYLAYHLLKSNRTTELVETVQDLTYLVAKIHLKGVYYAENDLKTAETITPNNAALKLLRRTISQAGHLLVRAKSMDQVANTLHSRLAHLPELVQIVDQAQQALPKPLLTARHPLPDLPDPALIRTLWGHTSGVLGCALSNDGSAIVSVDKDSVVTVWHTSTGQAKLSIAGHKAEVWFAATNANGSTIAIAYNDGAVALWDTDEEKQIRQWSAHQEAITGCALNADASILVTASKDKTLKVWDTTATGAEKFTLTGHQRTVASCDISANGNLIVSSSNDGTMMVWDGTTGEAQHNFTIHTVSAGVDRLTFMSQRDISFSCAISADGSTAAATSSSGALTVWDLGLGKERFSISADKRGVGGCILNANGTKVACALSNNTLKVWNATNGTELLDLADHSRLVNSCSFDNTGDIIVSASDDKTLKVWDSREQEVTLAQTDYKMAAHSCAISANGSVAISAMSNNTVKVWDVNSFTERVSLTGHTRKINSCAISLDGTTVVTASQDQSVGVWDAATGQQKLTLGGHTWAVSGCTISADDATIISASDDSTLKVWDANTGREKHTLSGHTRTVNSCAISANGYTAVSASGDGTLKVWVPHTGENLATLKGHTAWVNDCAISSNGKIVVSASFDKTLRVWDTGSATERLVLKGHTSTVTGCALSADDALIVSVSRDKSVKIWNVHTGQCLTTLFVDEPLLDCACSANAAVIVAVGNSGVYFLKLDR